MPTKVVTETQFARLLGNTPLQVHLEFLHTRSHVATHVSAEHLFTFYKTFDEVRGRRYDGMIILSLIHISNREESTKPHSARRS